MILFDTNMILRYLLNDQEEMADRAEQLLNGGQVFVTIEVIAEVVYVLKGVYKLDKKKIVQTAKGFLELVNCREMDVLVFALDAYETHGLDFIDCVLYSYHAVRGLEIATFDKKLKKLLTQA